METRARYTLIGLFSLALIGLGFAFVYWINTGGGIGARAHYRVRFEGSVAGLLKGSAVLFNGVRVGEVTALILDAAAPATVLVDLTVEAATPVRMDTRIGIEFQGLAGAPAVAFRGGSPGLPLLAAQPGPAPVLAAEKNAGRSMADSARDVLGHLDTVVTDNAEPLKQTIGSIEKFSTALARNSDRVDGILAGLERLMGGGKKATPRIIDLPAPTVSGAAPKATGILQVAEPTALSFFDNERVVVREANGDSSALENTQWPDLLSKVIQTRVLQSFENAGVLNAIGRPPEGVQPDLVLQLEVRSFNLVAGTSPEADIQLAAHLVGKDGRMVAAHVFKATAPAASVDPPGAAAALGAAFGQVASDIVKWVATAR